MPPDGRSYTSRVPVQRRTRRRVAQAFVLASSSLALAGCDTVSDDFQDIFSGFDQTSPFEAAVWAADFNNPGRQRQGVVLLSNAGFGGEEAYLELYRTLASESRDPLVRAAAIRALGRWGDGDDAQLIAGQLGSIYEQVRLESAIALQRIHEPAVEDRLWRRLVMPDEEEAIRIELAIALGQYASDASFQALCLALDDRSLAINLAAADSLRVMTGRDFGLDAPVWLSWYDAARRSSDDPFATGETYLYPTFQREIGFVESLAFWRDTSFEKPAIPRGLTPRTRSTYEDEPAPDREYENLGEGP